MARTPAKKAPSQARARPKTRADVKAAKEARIRHFVKTMAEGAWVPGVTAPAMAKKFRVSQNTVDRESAEASRVIRDAVANDDELRGMMVATLQTIVSRCMSGRQMRTGVEAIKAMAGLTGVEAPKKMEVGGNLGELFGLALKDPESD